MFHAAPVGGCDGARPFMIAPGAESRTLGRLSALPRLLSSQSLPGILL